MIFFRMKPSIFSYLEKCKNMKKKYEFFQDETIHFFILIKMQKMHKSITYLSNHKKCKEMDNQNPYFLIINNAKKTIYTANSKLRIK